MRRTTIAVTACLVTLLGGATSPATESGVQVPPGFVVTPYAEAGGLLTSLASGPDSRAGATGSRLYATSFTGGEVVVFDDVAGAGAPPSSFATGFQSPLGVLVAPDGTVYVSDAEASRPGPFGDRPYGRVWRIRDVNQDGDALDEEDSKQIVLKDLPNGRHNTNGLALGPDGMLYVANGNSTDDGVEGGQPEAHPWSGSVVRIDPAATDVSAASLDPTQAIVAHGMRNLYDLAFSPFDPTKLFITTNGADDARKNDSPPPDHLEDSDDLLYLSDIDNGAPASVAEDFGFPSCLYNLERQGELEPYDNPHPDVIEQFGPCDKQSVVRPIASFGLHPSADGVALQTTEAWGAEFRNDMFVAEFGNFFGDGVVGHKVVRVEFDASGEKVAGQSDFLEGVLPLDVTFDSSGAMFVADFTGTILKVTKVI
ncbi:MAG: PQQ-dependent sugar dehydrogenase [Actinomycetota bacterium]